MMTKMSSSTRSQLVSASQQLEHSNVVEIGEHANASNTVCNNTMVVINTVGARILENWIDNDNVTAVVVSELPALMFRNMLTLESSTEDSSAKTPATPSPTSSTATSIPPAA